MILFICYSNVYEFFFLGIQVIYVLSTPRIAFRKRWLKGDSLSDDTVKTMSKQDWQDEDPSLLNGRKRQGLAYIFVALRRQWLTSINDWLTIYCFTPYRQYFGHITAATINKRWSFVKFWSFPGGPHEPTLRRNPVKRYFACQGGCYPWHGAPCNVPSDVQPT